MGEQADALIMRSASRKLRNKLATSKSCSVNRSLPCSGIHKPCNAKLALVLPASKLAEAVMLGWHKAWNQLFLPRADTHYGTSMHPLRHLCLVCWQQAVSRRGDAGCTHVQSLLMQGAGKQGVMKEGLVAQLLSMQPLVMQDAVMLAVVMRTVNSP